MIGWLASEFGWTIAGDVQLCAICESAVGCPIFPIGGLTVNVGRRLFSQVMDFVPACPHTPQPSELRFRKLTIEPNGIVPFLELWRVVGTPYALLTTDAAEVES
jgi:hypothetical protein